MTVSTASIPVLHCAEVHIFTHKSWVTLVVHHTSLGEMTSKHTTRLLQRISLLRRNREELDRRRWGPPLRVQAQEHSPKHRPSRRSRDHWSLPPFAPQVSYPKPKRREPLKHRSQRATPRIKLHIPLIKLIKKDQVCYSTAPSTTNQNATQGIYIYKGYKEARKVLIGIQY